MAAAAIPYIGLALGVYGTVQQANAASDAASYNAQAAEAQAKTARSQAAYEALRHRRQSEQHLGAIRAGYARSGVTLDGSAVDILGSSAMEAEADNMLIEYGGMLRASGFQNQADVDRLSGRTRRDAGYLTAASTALAGGYDAYSSRKRGADTAAVAPYLP